MKFLPTKLSGNYLVNLDKKQDERGFFSRLFCEKEFSKKGLNSKWLQINNSLSRKTGTLRGLHFQRPPHSEIKLIRCIKGMIWDVVVDLRKNSKTFGKYFSAKLSEGNRTMMYVPKGFAHGFITLKPNSEVFYLISNSYEPKAENTLIWNDPKISIKWPISPSIISKKDKNGKLLKDLKKLVI